MIRSMTAYARREIKGDWGSAAWSCVLSINVILKPIFVCLNSFADWSR